MKDRLTNFLHNIGLDLLAIGWTLLQITIIIAIAWVVAWFARKRIEPTLSRRRFGRNGALLIGRLLSIAAVIGAFLSILGLFGANWTGLLTFLSAFTVAVGLSLQDVIRNFFSGILLLLDRPFEVGDRISVRDIEGEVQAIDVRTTRIRHTDGSLTLVPNAIVFSEVLINRSHYQTRRLQLAIISTNRSVDELQRQAHAALHKVEGVRKPLPTPRIRSSSTDGIRIAFTILINSDVKVEQAVWRALIDALGDATIEVEE